jgi:hypothetical protein
MDRSKEAKAMKANKALAVGVILAGLLLLLQAPPRVLGQETPPEAQDQDLAQGQDQGQDPPGRVARLDYASGSVSFQPGGQGDWVTAVVNRPLTTGDNLWADKDSRADLQMGSTSIRINSETSLTFLDLDDRATQVRLSTGSIILRVRHLDDDDHFEIDTPNLAFVVQRPGEYRIDVNADGTETDATVRHGRGEVTGGGASYVVVAGQAARFTGTDQLDHQINQIPDNDDFDTWALDRDQREDSVESSNYISTEMTGWEDLDQYGKWSYVADYGPVWAPAVVAPGWAPYRFGHWVWVAPWGWTWVEDEPWGFAPFHYGRWAFVGASWFWVPGPVVVRPVFAPALVAFVGGGGFGVGIGFGAGVAWFPLGPREVFVPWYRTSRIYVNNVNITNTRISVTEVTRVHASNTHITYVNQHVANGVTAVSRETFVNARPVNANLTRVDAKQLAEAPVARSIPVQPEKASVMGAGRPASFKPPAAVEKRPVVAVRTPSAQSASLARSATNVRTETPGRPAEAASTEARSVPRPSTGEGGHPLVRQAPPVQENTQHQQSEQQKFNSWQQQRPAPSKQRPSPPPRSEKHNK